ncbi:MAG: GlcNAc-PI de-N-acetylase [Trueperaceae bacterium]|jgi:LmbE family N-acetylglucosaminyl deacetylase|nr:GlcNAc-PI de-N-acetylase [Trueperaceae bacterium]MCH2666782.1 PIG-L family deacetylase [Deinococcales bacterium]|tara:strand:+ start:243 stop:941 length:699 start_codon:yes stop_codon:yes gene_type:complete
MNILAVFSHPDDELSCIGTLAKHAKRGDNVALIWTTHGEMASQFVNHTDPEVRKIRHEHGHWVAEKIGGAGHFFDMGDSRMTGAREEALQIARFYSSFKPDAIITWSDDHPHPDHRMTAKIAFDAITLARIPKILNEGVPEEEKFSPHRKPVQFFQYPSSESKRPYVHVNIEDEVELVGELFQFYQEFYKWPSSKEQFLQRASLQGRESGVKFAEKFQRRARFGPAVDYLEI